MFRFSSWRAAACVLFLLAAALGGTSAASAATKALSPVVKSLQVVPSRLSYAGGKVTVKGAVTDAVTCRISTKPKLAGFPKTLGCAGGTVLLRPFLPKNTTKSSMSVAFSVVAINRTKSSAVRSQDVVLDAPFHWYGQLEPPVGNSFAQVSCASARFCVGVDNGGNAERWNGTVWTSVVLNSQEPQVAVSCPSTTFCMALGDNGGVSTYDGSGWSVGPDVLPSPSPLSLSCSSSTLCAEVGVAGDLEAWNGSSWVAGTLVANPNQQKTSCGQGFCLAYDENGDLAEYTPADGWVSLASPGTSWTFPEVSCSGSTCMSLGGNEQWTFDLASASWTDLGPAPAATATWSSDPSAFGLYCQSDSQCEALLNNNFYFWDGSSWQAGVADGFQSLGSCVGPTWCMAALSSGQATPIDPASSPAFTTSSLPSSVGLDSISCSTSTECVAFDSSGSFFKMSGGSWAAASSGGFLGRQVSCRSGGGCLAIGTGSSDSPVLATWSGSTWTQLGAAPSSNGYISCPSASFCAVGVPDTAVVHLWQGGSTWRTFQLSEQVDSVSCVSSSFCVGTGGTSPVAYDGTAWSTSESFQHPGDDSVVDCTSTTYCMAVGPDGSGEAYWLFDGAAWGDSRWMPTAFEAPTDDLLATLSCSSASSCISQNLAWNGSGWSLANSWGAAGRIALACVSSTVCFQAEGDEVVGVNPSRANFLVQAVPDDRLTSLSCSGANECVAVDDAGQAFHTAGAGTGWSAPLLVDSRAELIQISCAPGSTLWCMAIDDDGEFLIDDAGGWTEPQPLAPELLTAVSCSSPSQCLVVDDNNAGYSFDGSRWTKASNPAVLQKWGGGATNSVSCTSSSFCMSWAAKFDGTSWSDPPGVKFAWSVSCADEQFCLTSANELWDGSDWSAIAGPNGQAVSCATTTFCVNLENGSVSVYDGTNWTPEVPVAPAGTILSSPSCPTISYCAAIGSDNRVYAGSS